jgi:hypothetical protein
METLEKLAKQKNEEGEQAREIIELNKESDDELTFQDEEHISELIKEGFREGELIGENKRGYWKLTFEKFDN